jgi:hypothetical protein
MGTWGPGLYSSDIAKDLKSTISAVLALPFDEARIVAILKEAFPEASQQPDDEDHTTFWLVLADQFHKKGIDSPEVYQRANEIIETGQDAQLPQHLEMSEANQKQRAKSLHSLRKKITAPIQIKARKTLAKPQPLVMHAGDVVVFPIVETGGCFNPYFSKAKWERADWAAAAIIKCGHIFDYLAYYCPIIISSRLQVDQVPDASSLREVRGWDLKRPGTCSKTHFKRMQLQLVDRIQIDPQKLQDCFPEIRDGRYAAINDISLANFLHVGSGPSNRPDHRIELLSDLI